jgi:glycosyltransferase involved in cell wall biosynthesis
MSQRQILSVVIPAYNEEDNIDRVYERLSTVLDSPEADVDWEIIFAMDPCSDATEEKILAVRARDPRVKALIFSRRFGQPAATIAGIEAAIGDAVVVIDCDLQDPPELITQMLERWRFGFDVVYAQRRTREGETLPKRIVAATGYKVIKRVADIDIPPNTGDFRLMSRRVVDHVVALNESHGFLRGLVAVVGFPQTAIQYDRDARAAGDSKYNQFFGSLVIGMNGIVSFSRYPLHLISLGGVLLSGGAFLLAFIYFVLKIAGVDFPLGNPTIVILVSLFAGLELFSIGIMGEYVGRIYDEVKDRPKFIVQTAHGVELEFPPAPHEFNGLPAAAHRGTSPTAYPTPPGPPGRGVPGEPIPGLPEAAHQGSQDT